MIEQEEREEIGTRADRARGKSGWWIAVVAMVVAVILVVAGILPRRSATAALARETAQMAVPVVSVIKPQGTSPAQEVVLPANVQAFADAPIYARTNGYLKRWYADIGTRVKAGQLLADIETPEVDQQLRQARAELATAKANLHLSEITANRYADLLKTDSVSKQDADNAASDFKAKGAIVQSAEANVGRLEELQSFEKITAPFSGVITARNTDVGALIESGSAGGTRTELFHIAQADKLRVYANVPEAYSQATKPGLIAELTLAEFPGRSFPAKLVRTAHAFDNATRTLLVEFEVNNPKGELLSGSYAQIHLKLPGAASGFLLPVNTLIFRSEGLRVAALEDGQHVVMKPITIGRDYGAQVEVVAGLEGKESIIVNPPDSLVAGQTVRVAQPQPEGQKR
jgi:RND family efflux transporter MFP subunit